MGSARRSLVARGRDALGVLALVTAPWLPLAAPSVVEAQDLASAQASLARYDLADPRTYEALEVLRHIADQNGAEAPTARAIRAYAAIDLLTVATVLGDTTAVERLGAALGTSDRAALVTLLDAELARTPSGALAVAAREGRATLAALEGREAPHSARNDALVLVTAPTDLPGLRARVRARFDPVIDSTLEVVPEHANEARRIIAAMHALTAALRAAEAGDPLLLAIRPRLEATRARLTEIVIADPAFDDIDAFLTLSPTGIAFGYVPRTHIGPDARPVLDSGSPSWPSTTSVPLPTDLPPVVRPMDGFTSLPAISGARRGRVALRIDGDMPAHLVARLVRTLEGSPLAITHLATPTARFPVSFVREETLPADAVRVQIRPGGYAVERRGGHRSELPRLRVEGHWRFDREGLTRALPTAGTRVIVPNALAPAIEVVETAIETAQGDHVTLMLP